MRVFGRWRKNSNNIPVSELDGNRRFSKPAIGQKRSLFDSIVGFDDVKELFDMSIRAAKPVHLLLVGPPASAKSLFMKSHPCPSTGNSTGACKGYVIDHKVPLKRGGADAPGNMQWQSTAEAKAKDRIE